jgi:hypothetical protein
MMNVGVIAGGAAGAAARAAAFATADACWGGFARAHQLTQRSGRVGWAHVEWPRIEGKLEGIPVAIELMEEAASFGTAAIAAMASPLKGHLELRREGFAAKVAKLLGAQDISLGDEAFDRRFVIKASDPALAHALLTPAVRAELLHLPTRWLAYDDGSEHDYVPMVLWEVDDVVDDDDALDRMLRLVAALSRSRVVDAAYR